MKGNISKKIVFLEMVLHNRRFFFRRKGEGGGGGGGKEVNMNGIVTCVFCWSVVRWVAANRCEVNFEF